MRPQLRPVTNRMSSSSLRPPPLPNPEPPKVRMTTKFLITVGVMLVALNILGVMVYRRMHPPAAAPAADELAAQRAAAPEELTSLPPSATASALGRAHRIAGLAALEEGDYNRAVAELAAAARVGGAGADVPELLRIAKELKDHQGKGAPTAPAASVPAPSVSVPVTPPAQVAAAPAPKPRVAEVAPSKAAANKKKEEAAKKAKAMKKSQVATARAFEELGEAPARGTLLVTSVPSGILVEVDGQKTDFTPARLEVETGLHEVSFVRGGQHLYTRRITVNANGVASLDADLSAQLEPPARAEQAPAREAPASVPAAVEREAPRPTAAPVMAAAVPSPTPAPPLPARKMGEVYVLSPEIYGDIYVNGTKYGFPPLLVKNLPPGKATVEVRINGVARRTLNVTVDPDHRQVARLR